MSTEWMMPRRFPMLMAAGIGMTITPMVLLMYGLAQFKIRALVGVSAATTSFSYSSALVSMMMIGLGPLAGWCADTLYQRHGRRKLTLLLGSLLGLLGLLAFALSASLTALTASWLLLQFGYSLAVASCFAWIISVVPPDVQGRCYGIIGMAIPVCAMLSSLLVLGALAASPLWDKLVLLGLLQLLVLAVVCIRLPETAPRPVRASGHLASNLGFRHWLAMFQHADFNWLFASKLGLNTLFAGLKMMPLFYVARLHLNEQQVYQLNALMAFGTLFLIVASLVTGYLADRWGHIKEWNIAAALWLSGCIGCYAAVGSTTAVIVLSCLFSFGIGIAGAAGNVLVNRVLSDPKHYGRDTSVLNASVHIGTVFMGIAAPSVIHWGQRWGRGDGYELFFLLLSTVALLSAACVWRVQRTLPQGTI